MIRDKWILNSLAAVHSTAIRHQNYYYFFFLLFFSTFQSSQNATLNTTNYSNQFSRTIKLFNQFVKRLISRLFQRSQRKAGAIVSYFDCYYFTHRQFVRPSITFIGPISDWFHVRWGSLAGRGNSRKQKALHRKLRSKIMRFLWNDRRTLTALVTDNGALSVLNRSLFHTATHREKYI